MGHLYHGYVSHNQRVLLIVFNKSITAEPPKSSALLAHQHLSERNSGRWMNGNILQQWCKSGRKSWKMTENDGNIVEHGCKSDGKRWRVAICSEKLRDRSYQDCEIWQKHKVDLTNQKGWNLNSGIWVNYNTSLTWNKAILGWFLLQTMIPVRSQWGRYNLPRGI